VFKIVIAFRVLELLGNASQVMEKHYSDYSSLDIFFFFAVVVFFLLIFFQLGYSVLLQAGIDVKGF
jgi:hypothetical protein